MFQNHYKSYLSQRHDTTGRFGMSSVAFDRPDQEGTVSISTKHRRNGTALLGIADFRARSVCFNVDNLTRV